MCQIGASRNGPTPASGSASTRCVTRMKIAISTICNADSSRETRGALLVGAIASEAPVSHSHWSGLTLAARWISAKTSVTAADCMKACPTRRANVESFGRSSVIVNMICTARAMSRLMPSTRRYSGNSAGPMTSLPNTRPPDSGR